MASASDHVASDFLSLVFRLGFTIFFTFFILLVFLFCCELQAFPVFFLCARVCVCSFLLFRDRRFYRCHFFIFVYSFIRRRPLLQFSHHRFYSFFLLLFTLPSSLPPPLCNHHHHHLYLLHLYLPLLIIPNSYSYLHPLLHRCSLPELE